MKERSINEMFRNVQKRANQKIKTQMPPLISVGTPSSSREHDLDESSMEKYSREDDQLLKERQNTFGDELKNIIQDHEPRSSYHASTSREEQIIDPVPELTDFIPLSHQEPPSNPHSREQTRFKENTHPEIRIFNEYSPPAHQDFGRTGEFGTLALQYYNSIVLQPKNQPIPFYKKSSPQIIKTVLTNPAKLKQYLSYIQQKTIAEKRAIERSQAQTEQKSKNVPKNLQVLSCLLVKIRECSIKNSESLPQVYMHEGEIQVKFETKKYEENPKLVEKQKKIQNLSKDLDGKDDLIGVIKQEYDKIIQNYAQTLVNLKQPANRHPDQNQDDLEDELYDNVLDPNSLEGHRTSERSSYKSFKLNRKDTFGGPQMLDSNSDAAE